MPFSRELKVGLAVLAALIILIFGIRFMEDLPLFRGTYDLQTALNDASGLSSGNGVRLNGVKVGSIDKIALQPESNKAAVHFRIENDVTIPAGSQTRVGGFAAFGNVYLKILPGPTSNPALEDGAFIPADTSETGINAVVADLEERAPQLLNRLDNIMINADATLNQTRRLLDESDGDLRRTLTSVRQSATQLDRMIQNQQQPLDRTMANLEAFSAEMRTFSEENSDSLSLALQNTNNTLRRLDANLTGVDTTTARLNAILAGVENGEGTLGMALKDSTLYVRLDSSARNLNQFIETFKDHPRRYLKHLTLVDIF